MSFVLSGQKLKATYILDLLGVLVQECNKTRMSLQQFSDKFVFGATREQQLEPNMTTNQKHPLDS